MATSAIDDGFVLFNKLVGHRGQVLCIAAPDSKVGEAAALIATGAEDSTVRLWDLRKGRGAAGSPGVAMCLCRCFDGEAVASVVFAPGDGNRLYCSAGGKVLEFDLRAGGGGLLVTSPTAVFDNDSEEVNELAVHPKGEYLAAADDSGVVKVYSTRTRRVYKTLRNAHTSICHAVRFRPRTSWDLASGALDSTLVLWDFSTGRLRGKLDMTNFVGSSSTSSCSGQQLFNPPFVHSVDFTLDGRCLAAGLGDSGVVILDSKTRASIGRCEGHTAPVSQVHYPCFNQEVLLSAGNDQRLIFWDHRPFEQAQRGCASQKNSPASDGGNFRNSETGHGAVPLQNRKSHSSGKRKARATKAAKGLSTPTVGLRGSHDTSVSQNQAQQEGAAEYCGTTKGGGEEGGGIREGETRRPLITSSVPLSITCLEEKPNWISSVSLPYDAILVADTSSEAKILRRRGT